MSSTKPCFRGAIDVDKVIGGAAKVLKIDSERIATHPTMVRLRQLIQGMAQNGNQRDGPVRAICARMGDKWSSLLVLILRTGTYRHAELRRVVSIVAAEKSISQRMLTLRLRSLERDGIINRKVIPTIPPHVEYSLTPLGQGLGRQMLAMIDWISEHIDAIEQSRAEFDSRKRRS